MLRKLGLALGFACVATMANAQSAETRAQISTQNNTTIKTNGVGAITAPVLNSLLGIMNASYGVLNDTNVWTGANTFTSPTINTPNIVGDNLTVNPAARDLGPYVYYYAPYFTGISGDNPYGSFGFELIATANAASGGGGLINAAVINPGAASCLTKVTCQGDIDFIVYNGNTGQNEFYSLFSGTATSAGGLIPDVTNRNILGQANNTWKWVFADAYYVQDATNPTVSLNNTTANGTETIAYQNHGTTTFGLLASWSGSANQWGLYDNGKTGGADYDIKQIQNGDLTLYPYGAIRLTPLNGYVISSALITAPDVLLNPVTISGLLAISCGAGTEGTVAYVKDTVGSAAPSFHLTVAGGGANAVHSLASCNGTNWQYD